MPAEALELSLPIRLLKYELRQDTGGAGRHRGGLGTHRDYEILADSASLSFVADRCIYGANGLDGGKEGGVGAYFVNRGKGSELASPKFVSKGTQISLKKGACALIWMEIEKFLPFCLNFSKNIFIPFAI